MYVIIKWSVSLMISQLDLSEGQEKSHQKCIPFELIQKAN